MEHSTAAQFRLDAHDKAGLYRPNTFVFIRPGSDKMLGRQVQRQSRMSNLDA